jgi:hypothetical protein
MGSSRTTRVRDEDATRATSSGAPLHSFVAELGPGEAAGFRIETPAFIVDASALPLVVTTIRALDTVDDVLELELAFLRVYEIRGPRIFITEMEDVPRVDRRVRHASAEMARRLEPFDVRSSLGAVIVVASPILRATIVALKWMAKPTVRESYVRTRDVAARLTAQRLHAAGLEIDARVEAKLAAFVDRRD